MYVCINAEDDDNDDRNDVDYKLTESYTVIAVLS
jgi:hypothetical protein